MNKSETNSNYYSKHREKILAHAKEYYAEHKDKVLNYKKQFYKKRTHKYNITKHLQLKGFNKKDSKSELKYRINNNCLRVSIINDNGNTEDLDYNDFLISYELKDSPVIIDFYNNGTYDDENNYVEGNIITIVIPRFYVKNLVFSEN
jgi:hypothetical protein